VTNSTDTYGGIIFGDDTQALGVLRALAKHNIPIVVLSWESGIVRYSNCAKKIVKTPPPFKHDQFYSKIREVVNTLGLQNWVAYPTDDDSVKFVAEFGKALGLKTWGLNAGQHEMVVDKGHFPEFAKKLNLRIPETIPYNEIDRKEIEFPVIIKPRVKEPFFRIIKKKAITANSRNHLKEIVEQLPGEIPIDHLLIQELIPGDGSHQLSYAALFQDGQPVSEITACRKRQHPPDFGRASTYVHTISDDEIKTVGRQILQKLNYTGVAEVEFKRSSKTGELYLLEINPRTWGWHTIINSSKKNWLNKLHRGLVNQENYELDSTPVEGSWFRLITDIPTALLILKNKEISLAELIKDYRAKPKVFAVWDRSDPMPFFIEILLLPYLAKVRGF